MAGEFYNKNSAISNLKTSYKYATTIYATIGILGAFGLLSYPINKKAHTIANYFSPTDVPAFIVGKYKLFY